MKKILLTLSLSAFVALSAVQLSAQDDPSTTPDQTEEVQQDDAMAGDDAGNSADEEANAEPAPEKKKKKKKQAELKEEGNKMADEEEPQVLTGHAMIKHYFIQGDYKFMSPVLICLILGLGIAIGRLVVLMLNWINVRQFMNDIEAQLKGGNVGAAMKLAQDTKGPIASIYYQGLSRADEGIDLVEKSIVAYGSVQMGILEKGLVWISLFISLAPMLGFMGTVVGMILAFDQIEAMGDINPSAVAGGIKVALLTTVAGLIVAIILQFFYNLITSIVDGLVNKMEDASINLVDMMVNHKIVKK